MAGSFTNYLENEILDHIFTAGTYTRPSTYIALFTAAPTDAGGGTEVSGGSYARVQVTAWDTASGGATANTNAVTFTTASASWGEIVAFAIMDAATTGNMLVWGDLTAPKTVGSGDTAEFAAGAIDITLD